MTKLNSIYNSVIKTLLAKETHHKLEVFFVYLAIILGGLHVLIIALARAGILDNTYLADQSLLTAVATPFTVILLFEVLMMILSVAKSIPVSVGKQYEIVALVLVRDVFKLLSELKPQESVLGQIDLVAIGLADVFLAIIFFGLIYLYNRAREKVEENFCKLEYESGFMKVKEKFSLFLVVCYLVFMAVFAYNLIQSGSIEQLINKFKELDFLIDLFTLMVLADVLILLLTFIRRNSFSSVFYEAVLVISAVVIRFAFVLSSPFNGLFAIAGIVIGVFVSWVYSKYSCKPESEYF